ncbi:V-type ATP synthase subunit A, partial [candidate division KSB1 bacterium]
MTTQKEGTIIKVSGPLVVAKGMSTAKMFEVVYVSDQKLVGEVIGLKGDTASIQVYEETGGVGPGEPVFLTGQTLSVELGPGLLENFYDGIQRPLELMEKVSGAFIARGIHVTNIDREKKWDFKPTVNSGDSVSEGDVVGEVQETTLINHKIMVPVGVFGKVTEIHSGDKKVEDVVAV